MTTSSSSHSSARPSAKRSKTDPTLPLSIPWAHIAQFLPTTTLSTHANNLPTHIHYSNTDTFPFQVTNQDRWTFRNGKLFLDEIQFGLHDPNALPHSKSMVVQIKIGFWGFGSDQTIPALPVLFDHVNNVVEVMYPTNRELIPLSELANVVVWKGSVVSTPPTEVQELTALLHSMSQQTVQFQTEYPCSERMVSAYNIASYFWESGFFDDLKDEQRRFTGQTFQQFVLSHCLFRQRSRESEAAITNMATLMILQRDINIAKRRSVV